MFFQDSAQARRLGRIYFRLSMSILELSRQLRCKALSPVELTEECLARIERFNPVLNAFITLTPEAALAEARAREREIQKGDWRGPLHGIPVGLKDVIDTAGVKTTAASRLFSQRVPAEDAPLVVKLRQAGAIILGKNNLHEFAYGGSSIISYFGEVRNPWNPAYIAGGSSGGSAAAVAAGLCYASVGTDTAGSIREPAAQCGIVGLKPTYGRVSLQGVIPLSPSLDHAGPLTGSVADAAALFNVIRQDSSGKTSPVDAECGKSPLALGRLRVGVPRAFFFEELDGQISAAVEQGLGVIQTLVADVREVMIAVNTDRTLQAAESYRYHADWVRKYPEFYDPETLGRILRGEQVTDAECIRLSAELAEERRNVRAVFEQVDALVTPTVPIASPTISSLRANPEDLRPTELILLRNTRPFNVWGLPAISIPCGLTQDGLPIGLQIAGPDGGDALVLSLAEAYEQASGWTKPKLPL